MRVIYFKYTFSFHQVDSNKDRLVTLEEFLKATEKKEFLEPDSWEVIEPTWNGVCGSINSTSGYSTFNFYSPLCLHVYSLTMLAFHIKVSL